MLCVICLKYRTNNTQDPSTSASAVSNRYDEAMEVEEERLRGLKRLKRLKRLEGASGSCGPVEKERLGLPRPLVLHPLGLPQPLIWQLFGSFGPFRRV